MNVNLGEYLEILKRRHRLVVAATLLCLLVSTAVVLRMTPIYEATARIEIIPVMSGTGEVGIVERLLDPSWALTQVELISSDAVLDRAAESLGSNAVNTVDEALEVRLVPETQIADITVEHTEPEAASAWANAIAGAFIDYRRGQAIESTEEASQQVLRRIEQVDQQLADAGSSDETGTRRNALQAQRSALETQLMQIPDGEALSRGGGNIISPATSSVDPVRPDIPLNLAISALLGLLLGVGAAFLLETLDDQLKTPEDIEQKISATALGYVPLVKEWEGSKKRRLATDDAESGPAAEAFRTLGINLIAASKGKPPGSILITSAVANAGKSTTSANLAAVMAKNGHKVILVAGDLRKPSIHKYFGLPNVNGIVDVVHGDHPLYQALQQNSLPNFRLLTAGGILANPTETLGSSRFAEVLEQLKSISDLVIIDSTPILGLGDASVLASKVDGVIMVVNKDAARGRELAHAAQQVTKAGGKLIGCVINGLDGQDTYTGYYDYGQK